MSSVKPNLPARWRVALMVGAAILGFLIGAFLVFNAFFLAAVLPHGGI